MKNSKNILFIGDNLSSLKLKSDSSLALAESALKNGDEVYWCEPQNLAHFNADILVYHAQKILSVDINHLKSNPCPTKLNFNFFHICFVRKDPPFDEDYKNLSWLLATQNKVKVINSPHSLLSFHEKSLQWRAYNEGILTKDNLIPTCLAYSIPIVEEFCSLFNEDKKFICKPWLGHGGEDILLFENKILLLQYLNSENKKDFLIQPFIEEITTEGDRRVILANGKVICDYVRLPAQGKIASNGAQGGSAILRTMTPIQNKICEKIALFLKEKEILFAGLDLIGNYVGEINITSPTGIRTYESLANRNVADEIFTLLINNSQQ